MYIHVPTLVFFGWALLSIYVYTIACIHWEMQSQWILNQGMESSGYAPDIVFIPTMEMPLFLVPHEIYVA